MTMFPPVVPFRPEEDAEGAEHQAVPDSLCTTAAALLQWGFFAACAALLALLCLFFVVVLVIGFGGEDKNGRLGSAIGGTVFFAVYATPITLVAGTPVATLLVGLWGLLARRGLVADDSRRVLVLGAVIGGATAPLLFWWILGTENMTGSHALITTFLNWSAASIGLLAPRLMCESLPPGRFAPVALR